jgi:hypothetical protein
MFLKALRNAGISLVLFMSLFLGLILPVQAAAQPVITQVGVISGERVQVQINFLPANTDFTVTEGSTGSQGIGHVIAHFNSNVGGTHVYWFEVLSDISGDTTIDIRIDNGGGIAAFATVINTGTFTAPASIPIPNVQPPAGSTPAVSAPVPGQPGVTTIGQISILKVERGGIVAVSLRGLPANTTFAVSINQEGTAGIGGSKVADLTTYNFSETSSIFEIPAPFRYTNVLDLRLDSGTAVYVIEFNNADFNN